jgi:hypothetical protein
MTQSIITLPVNVSGWEYLTGSSGGLSVGFVSGTGGSITLKTPDGKEESFRYGGAGAGIGFGFKLPRFGKVNLQIRGKSVGGAGALEAFKSIGLVLVSNAFKDRDLKRDDITGPCMFMEINAGLVAGGSGTAMLFGLDPKLLALSMAMNTTPATAFFGMTVMQRQLMQSAKGALLMAGLNAGAQAGVGGAIYLGGLF